MKHDNFRCPHCRRFVQPIDDGFMCDHCELAFKLLCEPIDTPPVRTEDEEKYYQFAKDHFTCEGDPEIDDDAMVSKSDDGGAYVQAWLWVENLDESEDDGDGEEEDGDGTDGPAA